jgi:hypothetical protein
VAQSPGLLLPVALRNGQGPCAQALGSGCPSSVLLGHGTIGFFLALGFELSLTLAKAGTLPLEPLCQSCFVR